MIAFNRSSNPFVTGFNNIDFADPNLIKIDHADRWRQTTIICGIAKTDISHVELQTLMEAGMNVAKFRMWVFTKQEKMRFLEEVNKASKNLCEKYSVSDWPIATCVELKTCQTKTGVLANLQKTCQIKTGTEIILTHDIHLYDQCNEEHIFVDSSYLTDNVIPGNMCSIGEDQIILKCIKKLNEQSVLCKVVEGGNLTNMASFNLKGHDYHEPLVSKQDFDILQFALDFKIDLVVINYSRSVECVKLVKGFFKNVKVKPAILCGICTQRGLANVKEILKEADGILLSREFLTYELEHHLQYNMNKIQKWLCSICQKAGKQLIIAGGVYEEAIENGIIYDAELFDIANSLLEGASGFILKNCKDIDYTVQTIKHINEMCSLIEPMTTNKIDFWQLIQSMKMPINGAQAAVISCLTLANQSQAKAIIIPTVTGQTARYVLDMRPTCIVFTVCTSKRVSRKLAVFRSVIPLVYTGSSEKLAWDEIIRNRVDFVLEYSVKKRALTFGDTYVVLQRGSDSSSFCDTVRIWKVQIKNTSKVECPE